MSADIGPGWIVKLRDARSITIAVGVLVLTAQSASAQGTSPHGRIAGVVFDSLVTNAPLSGAEVTVDGSDRSAVTDAKGRFTIDSVAAGRAVIRFYHSTLDSLGFSAAPVAVVVADSSVVQARLSTPSPTTVHSRLCPLPQPQSTGVLLGRVRNVDGRAPMPNADVTVRWSEWSLGAGALTRTERRASDTTETGGAYVVCGVPTDVAVVARATVSGHVTGLVEVDFAQRLFAVRDFAVSTSDSGATAQRLAQLDSLVRAGDSASIAGTASIRGTVRGPDGNLVSDAQVSLLGFPASVRTNSDGVFFIASVPAGSQTLDIRAVGFGPQRRSFDLATGERRSVDISLTRAAQTLSSVNIVGRGSRIDMTGFENRRKAGLGRFIGPEEIDRRRVFDTSQLLYGVPGTRVVWNGSANTVMFTRPYGSGAGGGRFNDLCNPTVFVDGFQVYDINDARPHDLRAIEVYSDQSAAPPMYRAQALKDVGGPNRNCGVVLIWTKPARPKELKQR
jgi:hypothetical protein